MPAPEPSTPVPAEVSLGSLNGSPAPSVVTVTVAPPAPPAPAAPSTHAFVRELQELVDRYDKEGVTLGALLERTESRGYYLLLILIALPFVTPIPLPGFSIPFGAAIALIGVRLILGHKTWLPRYVLEWEISPGLLAKVVRGTGRTFKAVQVVLKPRLAFMQDWVAFRRIAAVIITVCGLLMVLPLPLPFSNSLPAWTVLFFAIGALERDGLFFIIGAIAFGVTIAFFTFLAVGGVEAVEKLRQLWWTSG
ncbi:MAG: exopolysaccharide biosynthesis protein [Opitutaceae bacterium]|nr:exopolysaccharide biosynthesis protein [Opitutaceae bacterium]